MTPKSLLRHPMCISDAADFLDGSTFHRVLWDDAQYGHSEMKLKPDAEIKRVVLCSGKVYYDLLAERDKRGLDDVYLMRVEQLYPVPKRSLTAELSRFKQAEFIWCQEEPRNQGAWSFIEPELENALHRDRRHARPAPAMPAARPRPRPPPGWPAGTRWNSKPS